MKNLLLTLLFLYCSSLFAQEYIKEKNNWIFDRLNLYIENDKYFGTDDGYSTGERITALYHISREDYSIYDLLGYANEKTYSYFTFSLTNQIFTPTNTLTSTLIPNDRPYAGWTFLESTIHKTTKDTLRSLSLKVGIIGPGSGSQQIQNEFHRLIDTNTVSGWENQLDNEIGINLKYIQKWRYFNKLSKNIESSVVPFISAELGNVAINATSGMMARIGFNIPKDYGVSSVDIGSDPGIPVYGEYKNMRLKPWSFSFNLIAAGSFIGRDIFLDGNTFSSSHSVNIKHLVAYYGVGLTLRYKNFVVDLMEIETTKQFDLQKETHGVGTVIISYLF